MSPARAGTVLRGGSTMLLARLVFLASGFAVSIILARGLGPVEFGVYGVVITLLSWMQIVQGGAITKATAALTPRHAGVGRPLDQTARALVLGLTLVLFALTWAFAPTLSEVLRIGDGGGLFRIASCDLVLMGVLAAYQGMLNGRGQFRTLALILVVQTLIKLLGVLILLAIGLNVRAVVIVHVTATLLTLAGVIWRYPPDWALPSLRLARELLRVAAPIGLYLLCSQVLLNLGLWQLKSLDAGGGGDAGFYAAGMTLARTLAIVPAALGTVLLMAVSWAEGEPSEDTGRVARERVREAFRLALLVLTPASVLLAFEAEAVIALLFQEAYAPAARVLGWLLAGFAAFTLLDLAFNALAAVGRARPILLTVVACVPLSILANQAMIPEHGAVGAGMVLVGALVVTLAVSLMVAARHFGELAPPATLLRHAAGAVLLVGLAWLVPGPGWLLLLKLGVLGLVYLAVMRLSGVISDADLGHLLRRA